MDAQTIINLGAGSFLAVIGWVARQLWDATTSLKADLHKIEVDLPRNYVRREEFFEAIREIKEVCERISDKIDTLNRDKADK